MSAAVDGVPSIGSFDPATVSLTDRQQSPLDKHFPSHSIGKPFHCRRIRYFRSQALFLPPPRCHR
jgi:hypothetical protein